MEGISQSLAGRTALVRLLPFSIAETRLVEKTGTPEEYLFRGFYPRVWSKSLEPTGYYRDYFETYVQRDVRQMLQVKDLRLFRNFVRLCAGRVGQCFNASEIGNNLGVSSHTVKSWLSVLEASYIVYLMEPFSKNFGKRVVKWPKLYFLDVGFAAYLLGIDYLKRTAPDAVERSYLIYAGEMDGTIQGTELVNYQRIEETMREADALAALNSAERVRTSPGSRLM